VPFEVLEHPADIGFRVSGGTRPELFAHAAGALLSIASEPEAVHPREEYALEVAGADDESLMVNWLNEVLWWFDGKGIAFREFRVTALDASGLRAIGIGEPRDAARHPIRLIVKGVTYHQLKVAESGGRWIAEVYLDI